MVEFVLVLNLNFSTTLLKQFTKLLALREVCKIKWAHFLTHGVKGGSRVRDLTQKCQKKTIFYNLEDLMSEKVHLIARLDLWVGWLISFILFLFLHFQIC